jgi:ubiquinone/menaquinone biosynthesis C-methylase UbiE
MDPRLQRRIQRYGWDKATEHYERFWARQLQPAQALLLEMADLEPGERVIDVACGTGLVTFPAAETVAPNGTVLGTDISREMVSRAAVEASKRGFDNVTFERMDAETLSVDGRTFDAALCALGLMYVPDPVRALREKLRLLEPGGRAVASVWGARRNCGWAEIFPIVDGRVKTEVCPLFFQLGTADALRIAFEQAGFARVHEERIDTRLDYDSPEDACGAAFAGGPVALAYSRFDERTRDEAHAEYLSSIEPHRSGNRYSIPGEFVVVRGLKPPGD